MQSVHHVMHVSCTHLGAASALSTSRDVDVRTLAAKYPDASRDALTASEVKSRTVMNLYYTDI